jgi:hypothetical protein
MESEKQSLFPRIGIEEFPLEGKNLFCVEEYQPFLHPKNMGIMILRNARICLQERVTT